MLSSLGNPRQAAAQLLNFGLILSTAFMVRFHCRTISSIGR
jgi:signal peptidase